MGKAFSDAMAARVDTVADGIDQLRRRWAEDGVVLARGLLHGIALNDAIAAYEWSVAHPSIARTSDEGDDSNFQDLANPGARQAYLPMLERSPLPELLSRLWGGGPVWFFYEQIFGKSGVSRRTPWHQDTPYHPVDGDHVAVCWTSFESVGRDEALEFCLGSHRGPLYNGSSFKRGNDTDPFFKDGDLPRLPDVEATRAAWRIEGWAMKPGDVVIFHPAVLHGGGKPAAQRERRTLATRFFGEDATYVRRPGKTPAPRIDDLDLVLGEGDPFRHPAFARLV